MSNNGKPIILLKRLTPRCSDRTFGILQNYSGSYPICVAIERPWLNNTPGISCIPLGEYSMTKVISPHFGYPVFQLQGVPGRTAVEIHKGNFWEDSEGCIILGSSFGYVQNKQGNMEFGVIGSADAYEMLYGTVLKGIEDALIIVSEV